MLRIMVSDQDPGSAGGDARPRGASGVLFAVPRLFIGLATANRSPDEGGESERSPTSPLNPKAPPLRSPWSPRIWDSEPVELGLVVDVALAGGDGANANGTRPACSAHAYASTDPSLYPPRLGMYLTQLASNYQEKNKAS